MRPRCGSSPTNRARAASSRHMDSVAYCLRHGRATARSRPRHRWWPTACERHGHRRKRRHVERRLRGGMLEASTRYSRSGSRVADHFHGDFMFAPSVHQHCDGPGRRRQPRLPALVTSHRTAAHDDPTGSSSRGGRRPCRRHRTAGSSRRPSSGRAGLDPAGPPLDGGAIAADDRLAETALDSVLLAEGPLQIGQHTGDTEFGLAEHQRPLPNAVGVRATIASMSFAAHARSHSPPNGGPHPSRPSAGPTTPGSTTPTVLSRERRGERLEVQSSERRSRFSGSTLYGIVS